MITPTESRRALSGRQAHTTGFSRVVFQFQPKRKLLKVRPDTTGFSRVVFQFQPKRKLLKMGPVSGNLGVPS